MGQLKKTSNYNKYAGQVERPRRQTTNASVSAAKSTYQGAAPRQIQLKQRQMFRGDRP